MSNIITYSKSIVGRQSPSLIKKIIEISNDNIDFRLTNENVNFLYSTLTRKISTDYKLPMSRLQMGTILPIFDTTKKIDIPLVVPISEGGKVKTVFNLFPSYRNIDNIDNLSLLYKILVDCSIQGNYYENPLRFTSRNELMAPLMYFYEKIFMSVFGKLLTFNDANLEERTLLKYSIRFYVCKVLLGKPFNLSSEVAKRNLDDVDKLSRSPDEYFNGIFNSINSFDDYLERLNESLLREASLNAPNGIKVHSFIKQFLLMYPTLLFGIDMVQVMLGGLFGYLKSKTYSGDFLRLNKLVFDNKTHNANFSKVMMM